MSFLVKALRDLSPNHCLMHQLTLTLLTNVSLPEDRHWQIHTLTEKWISQKSSGIEMPPQEEMEWEKTGLN